MSFITLTVERYDGPHELCIDYQYTPGDPGVISGPPERCRPPEPDELEIREILEIMGNGLYKVLPSFLTDGEFDDLLEKVRTKYEEESSATYGY